MYGLVNAAVQDLVCTSFGPDKWEAIKVKAGIEEVDTFSRMGQYPDEMTYRLVAAASDVLGLSSDEVMIAFGEFWVLYTGRLGYGHLFDIAGNSLRDFLLNLDALHTRVGQNFTQLRPPSFQYDILGDQVLRMHYHSERQGFCPMVIGLLRGLSLRFQSEMSVEHPVCSKHGADHCEFLLTMSRDDA